MQNSPNTSPTSILENSGAISPMEDSSLQLALSAVHAAEDRKGADVTLLRTTAVSLLADYFVIITGFSRVQVRAIAYSISDAVEEDLQRLPKHKEGQGDANRVLLDYREVIVHVMMPQEREFYDLEAFWGHAEKVDYAELLTN
ncbi:MAG: ribosome silencing factor [Leptolyngbyaceae cyanobacterium CAN_BIN12]|nr:ribosome silencing factor [Leptolyngbyaceae cyanobacterium CAN_BIN12]